MDTPRPPRLTNHPPEDHAMIGIGMVVGFIVALLQAILRRRWLGLRAANTDPPIVDLRGQGWHWLAD